MSYLKTLLGVLYAPRRTLAALKVHPRRVRFGLYTLLLHSAVAITKQLYFHFTGQPVVPAPLLAIPPEQGWLYIAYFQVPTDLLQAIVFAGCVSLVAPALGGRGTFSGQFSLFAVGFVPPTIVLMLGTWAITLFSESGTPLWWLFFIAVSLWILVTILLAVVVEQDLDFGRAFLAALTGFIPSLTLSLTYIR
ncbi:MAG: hypothetical protein AB1531_13045 [Chloroflexota bacterium]